MAAARPLLIAGVLGALLGACAAPGPYPSLEPRPGEKAYAEGDPERVPTVQPDDASLGGEIARLTDEARAGDAAFGAALPAANAATGRAGTPGGESWVEAQQAISRVEAARVRTTSALAELDALAIARSNAGRLSPGDRERLEAAVRAIQTLSEAQAGRLSALRSRLGSP
jgi:multidrug efflux pump subunit AcrA (membrane-fusion protein)